tara:strand:- start:385 stop:525 length:141 start_codon:yes stop_codon:yes gene_type:complete
MEDLEIEDIMVKKPSDMKVYDKNGNEITRTDIPDNLKECKCEDCND